jgi:alkylation response protein AidB-like acyl-CoA dehydrogenase
LSAAIVAAAERLANEVLFPAALATDAADAVPVGLLNALAEARLYGLSGPASEGGLAADFATVCSVAETLAAGCLTTTFVWAQHLGAVIAAAQSENETIQKWVAPLCSGKRRAGLALGGAVPGPATLVAREHKDGWTFTGTSPFVSGWNRIDVIHTAACTEDGRLVWALVDAQETETLSVRRLELVALNATSTVRVDLSDHHVPAERVSAIAPYREGPAPPELVRIHASFALGVVTRCCLLLGPTPFDEEVIRLKVELDRLDPATIEAARGAAGELALRASGALAVARGSRSLLRGDHAQRLAREALFTLVYALRPASRSALLAQLRRAEVH